MSETPRVTGFKDLLRRSGWAFLAILFLLTGVVFTVIIIWQGTHNANDQAQQAAKQQQSKLVGTTMPGYKPVGKITALKYSDQTKGAGKQATAKSKVTIQYIGALASNGEIFDTSLDRGQAATFSLDGGVIPGFAEGIAGMKVGGTRQILIPAALAYGKAGYPPSIPPNADLIFTVSLVDAQ